MHYTTINSTVSTKFFFKHHWLLVKTKALCIIATTFLDFITTISTAYYHHFSSALSALFLQLITTSSAQFNHCHKLGIVINHYTNTTTTNTILYRSKPNQKQSSWQNKFPFPFMKSTPTRLFKSMTGLWLRSVGLIKVKSIILLMTLSLTLLSIDKDQDLLPIIVVKAFQQLYRKSGPTIDLTILYLLVIWSHFTIRQLPIDSTLPFEIDSSLEIHHLYCHSTAGLEKDEMTSSYLKVRTKHPRWVVLCKWKTRSQSRLRIFSPQS